MVAEINCFRQINSDYWEWSWSHRGVNVFPFIGGFEDFSIMQFIYGVVDK